jgi:hypothetical protein
MGKAEVTKPCAYIENQLVRYSPVDQVVQRRNHPSMWQGVLRRARQNNIFEGHCHSGTNGKGTSSYPVETLDV